MEEFIQTWLYDPIVGKIITVCIGLLILVVIVRFVKRSLTKYIQESDTRYRAKKFVNFMGYLIGILFLGVVFSDKLGGLTVALGVAGAGIAFALQEVIASVAGWLAVSFGNFYKTGDRVQLGGIKGDVIDIGVLRTTVMEIGQWVNGDLYNGRVVRIANSFVFKEPVFNYSGDFPFLWDEIIIPVRYGSDFRLAKTILEQVVHEIVGSYTKDALVAWKEMVRKYMIEEASVEPMVTIVANDNWMEYTIRYAVDYKKRRGTKNELFMRILEEVEKTNKRVELASATYELTNLPPVKVELNKS